MYFGKDYLLVASIRTGPNKYYKDKRPDKNNIIIFNNDNNTNNKQVKKLRGILESHQPNNSVTSESLNFF